MIKRIKLKYYLIISISLILLFLLCIIFFYKNKLSSVIINYTSNDFEKKAFNNINSVINDTLKNEDLDNFFKIYKNDNDEILYVDYDLKKTYSLLAKINKNFHSSFSDYTIQVNMSAVFNNPLTYFLGPKIIIKVEYIDSILTNVNTKISDYGLNNALIELYINIKFKGKMISTFSEDTVDVSYDFLIASKVINGKVPSLITSNKNFIDENK